MNIPISYKWLASHFEKPIPTPEEISRLFMLHLCEVEGVEKKSDDTIFDLKIMPDRGHDLLAHKGIAREVSVLAGVPMKALSKASFEKTGEVAPLRVSVEDQKLCPRYMGRVVQGVQVSESPAWLKERLESVGQRSINNIVDITNFVMLELGQPMHAFDADRLKRADDGAIEISVRGAWPADPITTLNGKELSLAEGTLIVASTFPLAIAGIKGGKMAEVTSATNTIIFEAANFDAVNIRRTSARIGIRTDSSKRFEHGLSPVLAEEAMGLACALIQKIYPNATFGDVVDIAAHPSRNDKVGISVSELNGILGTALSEQEIKNILARLDFSYEIISNPQEYIVKMAPQFIGKPYKYGASIIYDAPDSFDCSSMISYLYSQIGIQVIPTSVDQFVFSESVSPEEMRAGDLVFSNSNVGHIWYESQEWMPGTKVPQGIDHVGLYLGDGKIIHTSRYNETGVAVENLTESSRFQNITGVGRIPLKEEPRFVVTIPLERLDLRIKEDLAEEIGRIYGFHNILPVPLPELSFKSQALKTYYYSNAIRDALVEAGFSEVFTYSFQNEGLFAVENPIAADKGFLRKDLATGIQGALVFNARNASLLATDDIKIFEIGKVFPGVMVEKLSCAVGLELTKAGKKKEAQTKDRLEEVRKVISDAVGVLVEGNFSGSVFEFDLGALLEKLPEPKIGESFTSIDTRYAKLSAYPFVLRDIALWVPEGVTSESILEIITKEAGELLRVKRLFDVFTKELPEGKKTSYAFNLVFQSHEKTLSDEEVNTIMERVTTALVGQGYTVR